MYGTSIYNKATRPTLFDTQNRVEIARQLAAGSTSFAKVSSEVPRFKPLNERVADAKREAKEV